MHESLSKEEARLLLKDVPRIRDIPTRTSELYRLSGILQAKLGRAAADVPRMKARKIQAPRSPEEWKEAERKELAHLCRSLIKSLRSRIAVLRHSKRRLGH
jgi:hypothetical protein